MKQREMLQKSLRDIETDISIEENNRIVQTENLEADLKVVEAFRMDNLS